MAGLWDWRLMLRGAVEKLRNPALASFDGSTAARVAVRCAVRAPRRRAVDRDLDAIVLVRFQIRKRPWWLQDPSNCGGLDLVVMLRG